MTLFRDDFTQVHNGRRMVKTNHPKPIYGDLVATFNSPHHQDLDIIKMSTGIYYYRIKGLHNTTPGDHKVTSPYGWNYLHELFHIASDGAVLISDVQMLNIKYEISKHLMEIKFLTKEQRFKDISVAVVDFKCYYLAIISSAAKHLLMEDFWNELY